MSAINPLEASEVEVQLRDSASDDGVSAKWQFSLACSRDGSDVEQLFDFGTLRVLVLMTSDKSDNHPPMIRIRTERGALVENLTEATMHLRINCPSAKQQASLSVAARKEHQMGISSEETQVVIEIGICPDSSSTARSPGSDSWKWSSEVCLSTEGDTKPCIISFQQLGMSTLAASYFIDLKKEKGKMRISIYPQIVILNSTVKDFLFPPLLFHLVRSNDWF